MLTLCPSSTAQAAWWNADGDATFRASIRHLHSLGIERIYLAGLSNGGAGAGHIGRAHARELAGLILISGVGGDRPPAIPTLVIQGSRDRMMSAARARAYAAGQPRVRYREIAGGHLIFFSQHTQVRAEIAAFLRAQEARR
jgi:pimeloyl-ACP methyl ester carboxylesterase